MGILEEGRKFDYVHLSSLLRYHGGEASIEQLGSNRCSSGHSDRFSEDNAGLTVTVISTAHCL